MQEILIGNVNQHTAKTNPFEIPINATYVRIYPLKWKRLPCLRSELLGAKGMMEDEKTLHLFKIRFFSYRLFRYYIVISRIKPAQLINLTVN